jgi:hypothetical protein
MNEVLKTRLKSFAWRFGSYVVVAALAWLGNEQNIALLQLPPWAIAFVAYIVGEITKYVNNQMSKAPTT